MKVFAARTSIRATPERVWGLLTDAVRYPEWNSTVTRVDGRIAPDARQMPLGLFTGERTFTVTPGAHGVEFAMRETFTGLLAPLIGRTIPDLQPAFDEFAACLKGEAEKP